MNAVEPAPPQHAGPPSRSLVAMRLSMPALNSTDRRFWIGLSLAALFHVLLLVGTLLSVVPDLQNDKRLGQKAADPNGVSIEIIDSADLKSLNSVPLETTPPPPPPQPERQRPPPQPPAPEKPAQEKPAPKAEQQPSAQPQQPGNEAPQPKTNLSDLFPLPDLPSEAKPAPPTKAAPKAPAPAPPARKPSPNLDSLASEALNAIATSASRPAGITRSGENDDFGRNVIRALARVMPQINMQGRVTIRLLLNEKGNIAEVEIMRPSTDPMLDQNVVFSTRQASFPLPPDASTRLDRTFYITYIYR